MGTSLNGLTPAGTYPGLIKTGDNAPIDGTLKTLSDGNGNNLPMAVSTTAVNFTNQLQQGGVAVPTASQVNAKQDTLVSGTNIKTINGTSLLGSGNIPVVTSPSGVAGAIQFSNGSAFASDAANLFWDDTNNRLGVGTNAPTVAVDIYSAFTSSAMLKVFNGYTSRESCVDFRSQSNQLYFGGAGLFVSSTAAIGTIDSLPARLGIRGSGSTSATTSLLVQNSAGTSLFSVRDDGVATFSSTVFASSFAGSLRGAFINSDGNAFTVMRTNNSNGNATFDQSVAIGTTSSPVASASLELVSTTKGFLPPRMTTTQKNAIATPAAGLVVYDTTTNKLCCYNGSTWNDLF